MSVIVVTGAARGMGRACVDRLRDRADHLVAVDLDVPDIEGATAIACDISDADAVGELAAQVRAIGPFRSLVHAAGISPTMADVRRIFAVDLIGTQLLLDAFDPLVEPGSSAVCFASSAAYQIQLMGPRPDLDALIEKPMADAFLDGVVAQFDDSGIAYAWAKRGVIRAAARAAVAWGPRGGRVNSISPGLIDTGMGRQEFEAQPMMQVMLDATPVGRLGTADEVAAMVAFLVSDEATYVSGVDVLVDGGCLEGLRTLAAGCRTR
jgi:NAD(P)-dependent dehydrogenase (short-subunit alcohol dehydrogenase family)